MKKEKFEVGLNEPTLNLSGSRVNEQINTAMLNEEILKFMLDVVSETCTPTQFMKMINLRKFTSLSPDNFEEWEKYYYKIYTTYYDLWYAKYYLTFNDISKQFDTE